MIPTIEPLKIGVKAIKKAYKEMHKWQKTFNEMFNGNFVPTYNDTLEIALVDILQRIYNDKDVLGWWIYEMQFGKNAHKGVMTDEKGNNIPMRTVADLYRYYAKYTLNSCPTKESYK